MQQGAFFAQTAGKQVTLTVAAKAGKAMRTLKSLRPLSIVLCLSIAVDIPAAVPLAQAPDGHLTVPAYVDGSGPYAFILDTGADASAVYPWLAEKLKLPGGKSDDLSGQTGTVSVPMYRLNRLSIDKHHLQNVEAFGMPIRADGGDEAGVAGNDLMDGAVVVFDFPCHRVEFHSKPVRLAIVPKDAMPVDGGAIQDGTVLTLPVRIHGVPGVALLDTGSRDSRISPEFAVASGVDPKAATFRDGEPIYGFNATSTPSRVGPVDSIRFAGLLRTRAQMRVIALPALRSAGVGDRVMILGTDLMRDYRLVYDHQEKRFWFGSSACRR